MIAVGIDPGLEFSRFGMVQVDKPGVVTAYGVRLQSLLHGKFLTSTDDPRNWDLSALLDAVKHFSPGVIGVEVARGSVRAEVAADPIMRNNIVAGVLIGFLAAAGYPVGAVSAGGRAAGWNWRAEVGVVGKGAAERDKSLRGILRVRGVESPTGPRGGVDQDAVDALGIAAGCLDRVTRRPTLSPVDALVLPDRRSELILEAEKQARATRKKNRALKARLEGKA